MMAARAIAARLMLLAAPVIVNFASRLTRAARF